MSTAVAPVGKLRRVAGGLTATTAAGLPGGLQTEGDREVAASRLAALATRVAQWRLLGWPPADVASRVLVGALFLMLALRIGANTRETGHVTGLLLLASEALVVVLMIIRRPTGDVDRRWLARGMTVLSMAGPPLVRPMSEAGHLAAARLSALLPGDQVTALVSAAGLAIVIASKISLGRSFGLVPANRGVVCSGPYRLVRHPIYLGYLVTHAAFVVANPLPWNLAILLASDLALVIRARYEERTLERDERYVAYEARVRWRLVPRVF
jgi:hypothetical protein